MKASIRIDVPVTPALVDAFHKAFTANGDGSHALYELPPSRITRGLEAAFAAAEATIKVSPNGAP